MKLVSLSAPVTVQVREYIAPTFGITKPALTMTEMVGAKKEDKNAFHIFVEHYTYPPQ